MPDTKSKTEDKKKNYPILIPFRWEHRWVRPEEKTIPLLPSQATMLLLNGKVGQPEALVKTTQTSKGDK
ncbi:hypothetical protein [Vibrio sp. TRT 17S01]|uniref:hypothetical protein n=1 Tax=Vibrio sp. TRT 17S01 TaxID=3418505 RepID=UPI003CEA47D1